MQYVIDEGELAMDELFSVAGKTVVVTGGARGIGLMIASGFVESGAKVYITSRSTDEGDRVAAQLSELSGGGKCLALTADVSTEDGCQALAEAVKDREDSLDVLINNAGIMGEFWMRKLSHAVWQEVMAVNVEAGFYLVRDLRTLLESASRDGEPSRVINVGSVSGSTTTDLELFAYSASKAAVHHLTAHLARCLAPHVTVNALAPGTVDTRMTASMLKHFGDAVVAGIPMKRLCGPEDLVGTTLFLASRAGAYVTGAVIPIDGGATT
jgi:NAD(P)-dependent dehydrogenase (short-subunit alcohol dehydrogenase family)